MMTAERDTTAFSTARDSMFAARLAQAFGDAVAEFARSPASYLKIALLPDPVGDWIFLRLARKLASAAAEFATHPIASIKGAFSSHAMQSGYIYQPAAGSLAFVSAAISPKKSAAARRDLRRPILAASGLIHLALISYLLYAALLAPFLGIRVVNRSYRKFDTTEIVGPLHYPPGMLRAQQEGKALTLDEIRERDRKRREEAARREKAEREKLEREKAEREKAEKEKEASQVASTETSKEKTDAAASSEPSKFGEINEAPIKDIIGKVYALYQAGGIGLKDMKFSVMASFKIERDGSLSNIKIIKSSGDKTIDENALQILWNIGESHALGPLSSLTSTSVRLDLTDDLARLTITGFAPSPDEAKAKANLFNLLIAAMRFSQPKGSDTAELLSLMRISSSNSRLDAELTVSRARATQMMRAKFGKANTTPP